MHRVQISVIHLWSFCTLSQITPSVIWTKICGRSLNLHSCGPILLFLLRVRNNSRLLFINLCLYSKGEHKIIFFFENQFRKTILVWIPQSLRSLYLKKYFSVPVDWQTHSYILRSILEFHSCFLHQYAPHKTKSTAKFCRRKWRRGSNGGNTAVCHAESWKPPTDNSVAPVSVSRTLEMFFH